MSKPKPPAGLSERGSSLWSEVVKEYDLRADELRILEHACRETDLIALLEAGMVDADLMVRGSQGQSVINPIISELRQHRSTLATLLGKLKLPDASDTPEARSTQARAAAQARWSRRGA